MAPPTPDPSPAPGVPARHGLLPPALRRDLADLNGQYLGLALAAEAAADPRFGWEDSIRRRLRAVDAATLATMSAVPFALFRLCLPCPPDREAAAGIADQQWAGSGTGWRGRCASFAHQAVFFARQLVDAAPLSANVVLDLAPEARALLGGLCPSQLAAVALHPGLVRPRWPAHQRFWEMLEEAARSRSAVALQWAHCAGVCLLGADDPGAAATYLAGPRRRPRR